MKTEKNILIAFILNFCFAVLEMIGGLLTGSIAIVSDAMHDFGDAVSIGVSWFLEKKSKQPPDDLHTYGYLRYSVLGSLITTLILLIGSAAVIIGAVGRCIKPAEIDYNGMLILAVIGVCVNACAAFFTHGGSSLNQRAVNLHMLEDVLGWILVLIGAVLMRFFDISLLDPLLSIGVSVFLLIHAVRNLAEIADLFLEKTPRGIDPVQIKEQLEQLDGVREVHHMHIRSLDGYRHEAVMHIVTDDNTQTVKAHVRALLSAQGIVHTVLETEAVSEHCRMRTCGIGSFCEAEHHHQHHHQHHHHHH